MTDQNPRRRPRSGRARKRAIRAHAARAGIAYSVAARQLDRVELRPGETLSSYGRTVYPAGFDPYRDGCVQRRDQRSFEERVADTRRAAMLPAGRAQHLVERFPPSRARRGAGTGLLYHGGGRQELLALLYGAVAAESPGLMPAIGDLAWVAEMGEETALDMVCADADREARMLLDRRPAALRSTITMADPPLDGAGQILDALLIVADDGHAPGTRVRLLTEPYAGRLGTIAGARWGRSGPPVGYVIWLDDSPIVLPADPDGLVVLAGQEALGR
jgi:hypothetical protein